MSTTSDRSPSQIEREVEHTRSEVSGTLDALRQKLSPQQLVDQFAEQAVDYLRGSGGTQFASNLGSQVRDNPLPVMLIGAGVAWLMMSGGGSRSRRAAPSYDAYGADGASEYGGGPRYLGPDNMSRSRGVMDRAGDMADRARGGATDAAEAARQRAGAAAGAVGDAASRVGETIGDAASRAGDMASRAGDAVTDAVSRIGDTASDLANRASEALSSSRRTVRQYGTSSQQAAYGLTGDARRGLERLAADQPMVFGALGLALGAALGAILPRTEAENELMGEARDALAAEAGLKAREVYEQARGVAGEHLGRVTEAASQAYSEVRERVQTEGLAGAGEALGRAAENVAGAATEAVRGVTEEARRAAEQVGGGSEGGGGQGGMPAVHGVGHGGATPSGGGTHRPGETGGGGGGMPRSV